MFSAAATRFRSPPASSAAGGQSRFLSEFGIPEAAMASGLSNVVLLLLFVTLVHYVSGKFDFSHFNRWFHICLFHYCWRSLVSQRVCNVSSGLLSNVEVTVAQTHRVLGDARHVNVNVSWSNSFNVSLSRVS